MTFGLPNHGTNKQLKYEVSPLGMLQVVNMQLVKEGPDLSMKGTRLELAGLWSNFTNASAA